jgi:hypothetical protein
MLADFNEKMRTTVSESQYSIKFTSLTTLSFATYTYIHQLADPDISVNGGQDFGWGNRMDTEYSFLGKSADSDTLYLRGNLQNCSAFLIRATPEENEYFFEQKKYGDVIQSFADATLGKLGLHLDVGGDLTVVNLSLQQRQMVFAKEITPDSIFIHRSGITYDKKNSLRLGNPLVMDGKVIDQLILQDGKIMMGTVSNQQVPIIEKEYPDISAFKMFNAGAYSAIYVPFDNTNYIDGYVYEGLNWPNRGATQLFLLGTVSSDINIFFAILLGQLRFYDTTVEFKAAQRRFMFKLNMGLYDGTRPNAPGAGKTTSDEFYDRQPFPYQFRYVANANEQLTTYYEGPQFVNASQFPQLKNIFRDAIMDGTYTLKYTKSPTELLIAFYNTENNTVLFEGRPF